MAEPGAKRGVAIPEPDPERYAEAAALAERAPPGAAVGRIRTGTAGWTDRTLVSSGLFYPKASMSAEQRLSHYAGHFKLVEVDATYYSLLPPATAEHWVEWTEPGFVFDVKAHPVLTGHPIDVTRLPRDIKEALPDDKQRMYADRMPPGVAGEIEARFRALVDPLLDAGRLGCVMLQFPPWFSATRGNARRIEELAERWSDVPLSVEFRHRSWMAGDRRERVFELLRRHRLAYVCVDEPDTSIGGVPPIVAVTRPELALVRFHGQNAGAWRKGAGVHERFNYLYSPDELRAWVEPVRQLASEAESVHAVFNNCVRNYAVIGAQGLAALLAEGPEPPPAQGGAGSPSGPYVPWPCREARAGGAG